MGIEVNPNDEKAYAVFASAMPKDFSPVNMDLVKAGQELFDGNHEDINKQIMDTFKEKLGVPKVEEPINKPHTMFDDLIAAANKSEEKIVEEIKEAEPELTPEDQAIMEEVKDMPAEDGEFKTVMVDVNPATGERTIRGDGEFTPDNTSFDEVLEADKSDDSLSATPVDDSTIAKEVQDKFENITDKDTLEFVEIAQKFKAKEISAMEAFNALPSVIKDQINAEIAKAGIPIGSANNYRKQTVKSIMEEILTNAEMEQCSIDLDKQIANIYKEYGNDVAFLYQSNIYEKIKTLRQSITDMEKENTDGSLDEKIEKVHCIIDSIYESYELNEFADFAIRKKIKSIEKEKSYKVFREFTSKYDNSKFIISDVTLILDPLKKYCEFTDDEAEDMAILFCKYCANMRPANLEEHTFMYYFIANIISLQVNGVKDKDNKDEFSNVLISNLKSIMELRKQYMTSDKTTIPEYTSKTINEDYMNEVIEKAAQRAKEIEEENKKIEEELAAEENKEAEESLEISTVENNEE
jgi:hypothetical protein